MKTLIEVELPEGYDIDVITAFKQVGDKIYEQEVDCKVIPATDGKTKEEILNELENLIRSTIRTHLGDNNVTIEVWGIEETAKKVYDLLQSRTQPEGVDLRKELLKFIDWYDEHFTRMNHTKPNEFIIDGYLSQSNDYNLKGE